MRRTVAASQVRATDLRRRRNGEKRPGKARDECKKACSNDGRLSRRRQQQIPERDTTLHTVHPPNPIQPSPAEAMEEKMDRIMQQYWGPGGPVCEGMRGVAAGKGLLNTQVEGNICRLFRNILHYVPPLACPLPVAANWADVIALLRRQNRMINGNLGFLIDEMSQYPHLLRVGNDTSTHRTAEADGSTGKRVGEAAKVTVHVGQAGDKKSETASLPLEITVTVAPKKQPKAELFPSTIEELELMKKLFERNSDRAFINQLIKLNNNGGNDTNDLFHDGMMRSGPAREQGKPHGGRALSITQKPSSHNSTADEAVSEEDSVIEFHPEGCLIDRHLWHYF